MKKEKISFTIGLFIAFMITTSLSSCQKSLEERAKEEARNFTERLCPTPVVNFSRTDSMTFDSSTKTFVNHCTLTDKMDKQELINDNKQKLHDEFKKAITESTNLKIYKDAGFKFRYILRSESNPQKVLFDDTFSVEN